MKKDSRKYNTILGEIRKLGLDKKEAETYLLLLEEGPQTVLEISKQMELSRPTVYRVLKQLQEMELVFIEKQEKKSRFAASSPDGFLRILRIRRRRAEEQEREFLRIISLLQSRYYLLSNKNEVRFYDKKVLMEDFSNTSCDKIFVFYAKNGSIDVRRMEKIYPVIRKRMGKIEIREIFPLGSEFEKSDLDYVKRKNIKMPEYFDGTLVIARKVFILQNDKNLSIEEETFVQCFRVIFETIWGLE